MVHWQAPCLSLFQRVGYRGLTPRLSVCCSFEDFDCPFPSLFAVAGVAVHSTPLATTAQLAQQQGCSGVEVGCWSRRQQGFAGKADHVFVSTCLFVTWTSQSPTGWTGGGWKSLLTGFHCTEVPSSHLTQQWCRFSTGTALLGKGLATRTGKLWRWRGDGRNEPIRSSPVRAVEPDWSFLVQRWAGDGPQRQHNSCRLWRGRRCESCHRNSKSMVSSVEHGARMRSRADSRDVSLRPCSWRV